MYASDLLANPLRRQDSRLRSVEVDCGEGVRAALSHYAARSAQPGHRHQYAQVSFLLTGSMLEQLQGSEYQLHGSGVGYKPPGCWHSDAWGESGALIFSLKLAPERAASLDAIHQIGWARTNIQSVPGMVRACFIGETQALRREAVEDALATTCSPEQQAGSRPPAWLEAARNQIIEAPEMMAIEEAARVGGVHRVHLCRMFVRFYGVAPSVYRRRVIAARAVAAAARTEQTLTDIAHATGFSDQAHMTRTVRAQTGLVPSCLRAFLSD